MPANPAVLKMSQLYILWGSMLAANPLFIGVSFMLKVDKPEVTDPMPILIALGCTSLGLAVAAQFMRKYLVKQYILNAKEHTKKDFSVAYQSGSIMGWAMGESIGIFGLIYFILTGNHAMMIPFSIVSLIVLLLTKPSAETFAKTWNEIGNLSKVSAPEGSDW